MRDPDGFFCRSGRNYAANLQETIRSYRRDRSTKAAARRIQLERYVSEFRSLYNRGVGMDAFNEATKQFTWVPLLFIPALL